MKNLCFFARVPDQKLFDLVGFYKDDIDALEEIGYKVTRVNRLVDLFRCAYDGYYVWWFGYGIVPAIIGKLLFRPVIVTGAIHTQNCGSINDWPLLKCVLMKITMKLATLSLFISKTDFSKLDGFLPRNYEIVYCAVNLEKYNPDFQVCRDLAIMTISHLTVDNVRRKKIIECIRAFALVVKVYPNYKYWLVGARGDAYHTVVALIDELGLSNNVLLLGSVSEAEKISMLRKASVYLQPSLCEGFGLAILEAKACGTPVVTSNESCIKEINGDSVLYGDDVESVSNHVLKLLGDREFHSRCSVNGVLSLSKYSYDARKLSLKRLASTIFGS
jgi:glycosyltransferase involved in cell wall biosynthesis